MITPEIVELKRLVEDRYGRKLETTTDFEVFSLYATKKTGRDISTSTLKRLWGYVNDSHKPRVVTLDILAQYIGHRNFTDFTEWLHSNVRYNSAFFDAPQISSGDIAKGTKIEIGWSPNRQLLLKYLGDSQYEVVESKNSKLLVGDMFTTGCFIKGQPLYLPYIQRGDERTASFVAGRNGGLTILEKR